MAKRRTPKSTDQEDIEKAFKMIAKLAHGHPQIEPTLWSAACLSAVVQSYVENGFTYKEFKVEFDSFVKHCKKWFDE